MTNRRWLPLGVLSCALVLIAGAIAYGGQNDERPSPEFRTFGIPSFPQRVAASTNDPGADAFAKLMPVLVHPRCANCHGPMTFNDGPPEMVYPAGGAEGPPQQNPGSKATHPGGEIGETDCVDCHTEAKNWMTGPEWPIHSPYLLCLKMKAARSSGAEFLSHLHEDNLIGLAFVGMKGHDDLPAEPPPASQQEFIDAAQNWINAMNAMSRYPADPIGCPHSEAWVGSIQYSYSEVSARTTVTAEGKGQFPLVKRGSWSGKATRIEDHNAKDCASVLTGNAAGNGNITLTVIDGIAGMFTGFSSLAAENPTLASLMITPMGYSVRLELPLKGKAAYAGGGSGCPGYRPHVSDFPYTIRAEADGQVDPDKPDVLAGSKTTTPFPGATVTTTWSFTRTRQ